jgi:lysine-arginine-ornithine-binding protein
VIAAWLACSACSAAEPVKLRIGVEGSYPPFSQIGQDGKLGGFDIDIANALCARMNAQCTFVQQEWTGMIPALNAGKFDAIIASMAITAERRKSVAFSDRYYNVPSRWIVRAGNTLALTPAGLQGKRIGVLRNSARDKAIGERYKGSELVRYAKESDIFLDLVAGRLDLGITSSVVADETFLKKPEGKGYAFAGEPMYLDEGVAVALRKDDTALRDRFNLAIKAIRGDGSYQRIAAKYFTFDIYGS